jgi:hypothetical protein
LRRAIALACASALLAVTPVLAATSAYRHVSGDYGSSGGTTLGSTDTVATTASPAVTDTARVGEDRVLITAQDSSATPVALAVDITPPDSATAARTLGCGSVTLPVSAGATVAVTPLTGRCADGRTSVPRSGSIDLSFHRTVKTAAPAPRKGIAPPSLRYAVVIGIKDYAGNTEDTIGGRGDVLAVRRALIGSGWLSNHILTVTEQAASADGIRAAMDWLAAHSDRRTFSLLHYSGHVCIASRGPCASGHTYLWSQDNRFIPETEVVARMKKVQGRQWLDLSGCEGGAFDAGYHSATRLFTGSSQPTETSYEEPKWNESVWSGLTWDQGYNQGLADPSGTAMHATIAQMASYGVREAASYTSRQARGPQHPVLAGGDRSWSLSAPPGG